MSRPTLLGLPWDASSSFRRGAAAAPPAIRAALHSSAGNLWSEGLRNLGAPGALADVGDLELASLSPAGARLAIEQGVAGIVERGDRPLLLGGDHSVSYPALRGLGRRQPGLTILHVDAHPDLYHDYDGDAFSHACPFARVLEAGLAARLVQVGIRAVTGHQREQAERFGVETIDMEAWARGARPEVAGDVYLSLDLDGIDPGFAPGVAHPEPGGLSVREVITVIQELGGSLVGADVVELNPAQDPTGITAIVAAKLVKEIAGRMLADG